MQFSDEKARGFDGLMSESLYAFTVTVIAAECLNHLVDLDPVPWTNGTGIGRPAY
jgi:hypothetical protein